MNDLTTGFIGRLRARDPGAWFELWEIFGPVLRAQLSRWGRGRIGIETVQDLSQETMVALASAIDRHDPNQGARFSTWLLAIARYTLGDEIDRRMAQKRGSGVKPKSLDDSGFGGLAPDLSPDGAYELAVFDAKVEAALRQAEREVEFMDFEIFRRRVLEGQSGKEVAASLGTSEPTVSRRLASVRKRLREKLFETFSKYSFTAEEMAELARNGIELNPNKKTEADFEEAVAEVYHRIAERRAAEAAQGSSA
ncbi:MAG: sigma-70 family RNA polymerase sigma factor [bacterium]|nr:sigma-70 family RNA polymerase sigma factor [bacterium]